MSVGPTSSGVDVVAQLDLELGEGPVWDERNRCLWFVDVLAGQVLRWCAVDDTLDRFDIGRSVGALALTDQAEVLVAHADGFGLLDPIDGSLVPIADVDADQPEMRMNDGGVDPWGRMVAGTMHLAQIPGAGRVVRLEPNGIVTTLWEGVTVSNGIDWDAGGAQCFYIDSPTRRLDVIEFDVERGDPGQRRCLVDLAEFEGVPDGLTIDQAGNVWVCFWGGGAVRSFDPSGRVVHEVRVPVSQPTSCAFGGDDLTDLYITTAHFGLDARRRASEPLAGSLLRVRPGSIGRPPRRWASPSHRRRQESER